MSSFLHIHNGRQMIGSRSTLDGKALLGGVAHGLRIYPHSILIIAQIRQPLRIRSKAQFSCMALLAMVHGSVLRIFIRCDASISFPVRHTPGTTLRSHGTCS